MRKAARKAEQAALRGVPPTARAHAAIRKPKRDESNYHKGSCAMRLIEDPERAGAPPDAWKNVQPGDFWWGREAVRLEDGTEHGYRVMWAKWPDGCFGCIPIEPVPDPVKSSRYARPTWGWDQNERAPTLTPSIHHIGHWHGWVRAGRMESV